LSNYTETEVKLYVPDLKAVEESLQALGAKLITARVFERNVRYENAAKDLSKRGIVVRLRQDNRVRLTYKEPPKEYTGGLLEEGIMHRFEAEVQVDHFETMALILEKLGYTPHMTYEKYRTTYEIGGAEVVLDEMPYGNFVEIEGDGQVIPVVLEKLGLQNAKRFQSNYVKLLDSVRHHLKLDFTDLTFENFKGIDVPEDAFSE
jgi:adenylate cyclase, class 2